MIKSIEDPSQERYVLITTAQDFTLVILNEETDRRSQGTSCNFALVVTEVALAIQFEEKNFSNLDYLLGKIKIRYARQRLQYLAQIIATAQGSASGAQRTLG